MQRKNWIRKFKAKEYSMQVAYFSKCSFTLI